MARFLDGSGRAPTGLRRPGGPSPRTVLVFKKPGSLMFSGERASHGHLFRASPWCLLSMVTAVSMVRPAAPGAQRRALWRRSPTLPGSASGCRSRFLTNAPNGARLILTRSPPLSLARGGSSRPFRSEGDGRQELALSSAPWIRSTKSGRQNPTGSAVRPEPGFLGVSPPLPRRELGQSAACAGAAGRKSCARPGTPHLCGLRGCTGRTHV
ncbi:hypothetical protein HJG60_009423 [Phyllostomus discolor]|uniref:Uncharacterized protein n=1 Tax=Phyllostomus discolor TaxID=89673 RepID=A0A834DDJ5_9CHIR|nr:hypothetical protein HJG60_009423 [Phyllostomus discolor]